MRNKDDIFKEARQQALKKQLEESNPSDLPVETKREELIAAARERLEEGETQWDLLQKMIEGSLTEKFIRVISAMPDRDFARNYLKLLEYFKPKMTRIEGDDGPEKDTTINIQMVMLNDKGEKEIMTIEDVDDGQDVQE